MIGDKSDGLLGDVGFAAEALEPVDIGFGAEPGSLAFGVVAVALLGLGDGGFEGELVAQDGGGFGVAEGGEGAAVRAVAGDEGAGFFDEAYVEHHGGALVDALVEEGSRRSEAEAEDAVSGEGFTAFFPLLG